MFDYLHACEPGALINLGVHSHFGGRPLMAAMFRKILEYFRGHKDVWFAHHHEVAKWIVDQKIEDTSYATRFPPSSSWTCRRRFCAGICMAAMRSLEPVGLSRPPL